MSSASISGVGQGLYAFLQSLSNKPQSQSANQTDATAAASATGQSVRGAGHHHHGGHGGMFKQIETAVTSAVQSAQSDGTDPNQAVEQAIAKVFKDNGITPPTQTAGGTSGDNTTPTAAAGATGTNAPSQSTSDSDPARQAFLAALQSVGIDPQQFHQDLLAAIQDAQNGQATSASSKSLPMGMSLDTTA